MAENSYQGRIDISPRSSERLVAEIFNVIDEPGGKRALELRVNIEGQPRTVLLSLDALEGHGLSGLAGVEALRKIAEAVDHHRDWMEHIVNAIPNEEKMNDYIDRLAARLKGSR